MVKVKKMHISFCYILKSLVSLQHENVKKSQKLIIIVNIPGVYSNIFWTTCKIPINFSGKMRIMIILKVTKKTGLQFLSRRCMFGFDFDFN